MISDFQPVIGLEVHAQLLTTSKLFSTAGTTFGAEPNTHTTPVCLGFPGALPVLNARVVELAIRTGLALECRVNEKSEWSRKHYFYPDSPKGYQITQYEFPICEWGGVTLELAGKRVRIRRIHIEEDAGKSVHDAADGLTLVDLNRVGTPLLEIVSEPDLRSADVIGADTRGADLRGADLRGALFLLQSQLDAARGDASTRLPLEHAVPAHWSRGDQAST